VWIGITATRGQGEHAACRETIQHFLAEPRLFVSLDSLKHSFDDAVAPGQMERKCLRNCDARFPLKFLPEQ
jgi:hypothetical protein